ncbi:acyl-CoA thioesterase FadM [Homoserinimonas aerilata]|uniref:Acyl-CoA thioesterase FadM n=2 Tax=Homoserinimonas aerilata TaxID=1162970 RepID=A0A542XX21_9MICO|nr:acyl-CoA thioesterase FadM [Homoserinimonas aerilata]
MGAVVGTRQRFAHSVVTSVSVLAVNMFLRTFLIWLKSRRGARLGVHDVGRVAMRVMPNDLDTLGHVNNGVYFSLMDLGRFDLLHRSGAWAQMMKHGIYPVVANETMTFRKSLQPWQRYTLESRIDGYDEKAVYIRQRFVVDGEIYAEGFVRGRFLKRSGGTVSLGELADVLGVDISGLRPPEWVADWVAAVSLPATKAAAPSIW